jgi:uncharacterized protein (TIGR02145 family)
MAGRGFLRLTISLCQKILKMKPKKQLNLRLFALAIAVLFITCTKEKQEDDTNVEFPETVTDYDGNVYDVVVIGSQAWMKQNLRVTRYSDGSPIQTGLNYAQQQTTTIGTYDLYPHENVAGIDSKEEMKEYYGLLYNWHAVADSRGLCPAGWRVPSVWDWGELQDYMLESYDSVDVDNLGNALKSCRQLESPLGGDCSLTWGQQPYWFKHDENYGIDIAGFNALPAGTKNTVGEFSGITGSAVFWESTHGSDDLAPARYIFYNTGNFKRDNLYFVNNGFSVRCIWNGD